MKARWFYWQRGDGSFWFRIKGYGISIVDHRRWAPSFSERLHLRRVVHVGPWCIRWLSRRDLERALRWRQVKNDV